MRQLLSLHSDVAFAGVGQTLPHAPQFAGSSWVRTHAPEQTVAPPLHEKPHAPLEQRGVAPVGAVQTRPHAPQFEVSTARSTQDPEQFWRPPSQARSHVPFVQTSSSSHSESHVPQCTRFESKSVQTPSQFV